jgi:hypothetical protein
MFYQHRRPGHLGVRRASASLTIKSITSTLNRALVDKTVKQSGIFEIRCELFDKGKRARLCVGS